MLSLEGRQVFEVLFIYPARHGGIIHPYDVFWQAMKQHLPRINVRLVFMALVGVKQGFSIVFQKWELVMGLYC